MPTAKTKKQPITNITLSRTAAGLVDQDWPDVGQPEGELSIDVFHDRNNVYIQSTVAGVKPSDLEISVHHDMVTIRGERKNEHQAVSDDYFCRECFWGRFSRSVILPFNVQTDKIEAELTDGILTVTLPKLKRQRTIPIAVT